MMADAPQPQARSHDPIGVFDSGVGGLSVLQALRTELPDERFVYVADSGHAPYGERDDSHVIARAQAVTRYLTQQHHIKALVVACNTATATAIRYLRQDHTELPIVGIEPALKTAASQSQTRHIGVMATQGTLNSEKFRTLLASLQGHATFVLQPCNGLADAIDRNNATKMIALCSYFTTAMGRFGNEKGEMDTLVLGCTHYPFAADILRTLVGQRVALLEGGAPVARQTRRLLAERSWLAEPAHESGKHTARLTAATTGNPQTLSTAIQRWLQLNVDVQALTID